MALTNDGPAAKCEQNWTRMPSPDRETFLGELERAIDRQPTWWNGATAQEIAQRDFDALPSGIKVRLMAVVTEGGFSLDEAHVALLAGDGVLDGK